MNCWGVIIMVKFNIGDEVVALHDFDEVDKGMTGTVVHLYGGDWIGVEWDDFRGGHHCDGYAKEDAGYYITSEKLSPLNINLINE